MRGARLTRRDAVLGGSFSAIAALAAACGGEATREAQTPPTPAAVPVKLTYWSSVVPGNRLGSGVLAAINDFSTRGASNITIETGEGGAAQNLDKIKTAIAAGTQPDLFGGQYQLPAVELFALGAVIDLNAELRTNKDWAKSKTEISPQHLEGCSWKGKLAIMPMMLALQLVGFNKQIMSRAGVALPAQGYSWNDFLGIGRATVQRGERWLMPFDYTWPFFHMWLYSNGHSPINADRTKLQYDTPQGLETLQWLHDMVTANELARGGPAPTTDYDSGKFVTESVNEAAAIPPPRYPNVDPGDGSGIFVTHYPFGPSNARKQMISYGNSYGLIALKSNDAKRISAAAEVAGWAGKADVQTKVAEASGHTPPNLTAAAEANLPARIKSNPILNRINEFGKFVYLTPNFPSWLKGMMLLNESMARVAKGELRPKDALAEFQPQLQTMIDEDLKRG